MKAATYDIEFKRGDDYELFGRVRTMVWDAGQSKLVPGPYRDITGWSGLAQVRTSEDATTTMFAFTVALGNQETVPGSFYVRAVPNDTKNLTVLVGVWDLQWTTDTGKVYTYVEGKVTLDKDTSRA